MMKVMNQTEQVRFILEPLLSQFSRFDLNGVDSFAQITVNERSSFLDLQRSIQSLIFDAKRAYEVIRKLQKHEIYKAIAGRKLLILRLYFQISNVLGYERKIDKEKRGIILKVMKDFDFFNSDLTCLIKSCLEKTGQVYELEDIQDIQKAIQDQIGSQNLIVIFTGENGDRAHMKEKDIKIGNTSNIILIIDRVNQGDDEIQINCKQSGYQKCNNIKIKKVRFDNDKDEHQNISLSQFSPKKIFLKLPLQLLEDKNQLREISKYLQPLQSNYLQNLDVKFLTYKETKIQKKAQIYEKLFPDMENQTSKFSCFLQFLQKQSTKDTNYSLIQYPGGKYYHKVKAIIAESYPEAQITIKEPKRGIDSSLKSFINKNKLQQCLSQRNYQGVREIMHKIDNIRERYPTDQELKAFQQKSFNLICKHLLSLFNFRSKQGQKSVKFQELLQIFKVNSFIQCKFKQISQQLEQLLREMKRDLGNIFQKLNTQISQDMIESLLKDSQNCAFQMNTSQIFAENKYNSIISKVIFLKTIQQILLSKKVFKLENKDNLSKEKEQSRNQLIKMISFVKTIESRLNIKRYIKYIVQQQIEKMEEQLQRLELPENKNSETPQQQSLPKQIQSLIENLFIQIKSQADYVIAMKEQQQENLRDLYLLMTRLSEKKFICRYIQNNYKFNIKISSQQLRQKLSPIHHLTSSIKTRKNQNKYSQKLRILSDKKLIDGFMNVSYTYSYGSDNHNHIKSPQNVEQPSKTHEQQQQIITLSSYQQQNEQFQKFYEFVFQNCQNKNGKIPTTVKQQQLTQHQRKPFNLQSSQQLYQLQSYQINFQVAGNYQMKNKRSNEDHAPKYNFVPRIWEQSEVKIDCSLADQEDSKKAKNILEK